MLALRQGAVRLTARPTQLLRTTRRYASSGGHGAESHGVNEPIGPGFWLTVAGLPFGCFVYMISRPGENGETPALTKWIQSYWHWNDVWLERNALHSEAIRQAAVDRLLFSTAPRAPYHELRFPEVFQSHSPRNLVPGSLINLDAVTERYRQQHLKEEDRKARKLAASLQAEKEKATA